jgi:hypothetical protein
MPGKDTSGSHVTLERTVTLGLAVIGAAFAMAGLFEYGVWQNRGPGAGFFPLVIGGAMVLLCATVLVSSRKTGTELRPTSRNLALAAGMIAVPGCALLIGMTPAIAVFILAWIRLIERRPWRQALVSAAAAALGLQVLFSIWLGIRLPEGLLFARLLSGG